MLCQKCGKNEATFHKKTITNGVFNEVHLCYDCHNNEEYDFAYKLASVANLFNPSSILESEVIVQQETEPVCEECGTTYSEFINSAYVGCSKCYEKFRPTILQMCENYHGKTCHVENNDEELKQQYQKLYELAMLQARYEDAKKIKNMLEQLVKGGE